MKKIDLLAALNSYQRGQSCTQRYLIYAYSFVSRPAELYCALRAFYHTSLDKFAPNENLGYTERQQLLDILLSHPLSAVETKLNSASLALRNTVRDLLAQPIHHFHFSQQPPMAPVQAAEDEITLPMFDYSVRFTKAVLKTVLR